MKRISNSKQWVCFYLLKAVNWSNSPSFYTFLSCFRSILAQLTVYIFFPTSHPFFPRLQFNQDIFFLFPFPTTHSIFLLAIVLWLNCHSLCSYLNIQRMHRVQKIHLKILLLYWSLTFVFSSHWVIVHSFLTQSLFVLPSIPVKYLTPSEFHLVLCFCWHVQFSLSYSKQKLCLACFLN